MCHDIVIPIEWICALSLLLILAGKIPSVDGMLGSNQQRRTTTNWEVSRSTQQIEVTDDGDDSESLQMQPKIVVTPAIKIPSWEAMQPLVVASSSVFVRSFMLQFSIAGAAAMATRSGGGTGSEAASASIAAHQIALQLWLLCSFVCDALAAASQALVADRLGREDAGKELFLSCLVQLSSIFELRIIVVLIFILKKCT